MTTRYLMVDMIVKEIENHFGRLSLTKGDTHDFLAMDIKFINDKNQVQMNMVNQVKEAIEDFCKMFRHTVNTPATRALHYVNPKSKA